MSEIRKGTRVVVIEGPEHGTEGTLESIYKAHVDYTSRKFCTIKVREEGGERIVKTRLAWVRETEANFTDTLEARR